MTSKSFSTLLNSIHAVFPHSAGHPHYWRRKFKKFAFLISYSSKIGKPVKIFVPYGVHLFMTSVSNTASCAKWQANLTIFPSTFSLGYFNSTSSIVPRPLLTTEELGRLLLLEAIAIQFLVSLCTQNRKHFMHHH